MSRPPRPSEAEAIAATAAAWLAERDAGFLPGDAAKFAAWRAADPRHEAAVARLERTWAALQPLREFRPAAVRHPDRNLLAPPAREAPGADFPARRLTWALAAAAALAVAAGWWALRPGHDAPAAVVHSTTAGGYERVMLADGSVLELNGDTAAEVRLASAERRVRLVRGEAHFTVARDAARPFVVEAGGVAVQAVGTAFNVRLGAREVEVLVTEGKVSVAENAGRPLPGSDSRAERDPRAAAPVGGGLAFLNANDRLVVHTATLPRVTLPPVEKVSPAALRDALAWQGPRLVFADTPLAEAIAQFNRRNVVQLILADPDAALAALPIGGSFRAEHVEAFVRLLENGGEVAVDRTDPARLVLRRAK